LDVKKVLELLKRELEISKNISSSAPELKTDYSQSRVIITPKMVRKILIFLLGLACLIYLVWQINAIFSLPSLTVISPNQDLIIKENFITVEGQTEPEVGVTINNQEILTDRDGYFSQEIDLQTGLNTIEIKAKKKRSQANVVVRQVMVEQEESTFTP